MQCFTHENEEWCYSRACPACVVHHTLSDEAPLRLAITASLMATEATSTRSSSASSSPSNNVGPAPLGTFLTTLRDAVASDPFWGPRAWSPILSKATALHASLRDLIAQASELETLVLSPQRGRSPVPSPSFTSTVRTEILASPTRPSTPGPQYKTFPSTAADFQLAVAKLSRCAAGAAAQSHPRCQTQSPQQPALEQASLPNLRPSPLAKQQLRMDSEQRALVHKHAWRVHAALSMPVAERLATRRGRRRYREEDLLAVEAGRSRSMTT